MNIMTKILEITLQNLKEEYMIIDHINEFSFLISKRKITIVHYYDAIKGNNSLKTFNDCHLEIEIKPLGISLNDNIERMHLINKVVTNNSYSIEFNRLDYDKYERFLINLEKKLKEFNDNTNLVFDEVAFKECIDIKNEYICSIKILTNSDNLYIKIKKADISDSKIVMNPPIAIGNINDIHKMIPKLKAKMITDE